MIGGDAAVFERLPMWELSKGSTESQLLADEVATHFIGNRSDPIESRVAPIARRIRLRPVSHSAENLNAIICSFVRIFRRDKLRHGRFDSTGQSIALQLRGLVCDQTAELQTHCHVSQIVLNRLHLTDRPSKGNALLRVTYRILKNALMDSATHGGS